MRSGGKKIILHLCADLGSDSFFYQNDENYRVILIGENIGVENYIPPENVHGIIANPVCTEFSTASNFNNVGDLQKGMKMVNDCLRIIKESNPRWHVIENPFNGRLKEFLGKPKMIYQPWQFGSPWTKKTALWGSFNRPVPIYNTWGEVPKNEGIYQRPGRSKPSLAFLHKSAIDVIEEFEPFKPHIKNDADFRSLCSQGFAKAFYLSNP